MESVTSGLSGFFLACKLRSRPGFSYCHQYFKVVFLALYVLVVLTGSLCHAKDLEYSVVIPCQTDKQAYIVYPDGSNVTLGNILSVPASTRWPSYTASKWAKPGTVCASAVNAIHLLVHVEKGRGRTFSILPGKTIAPAAGKGNAFIIDTKAGTGIFGRFSPVVGSTLSILDQEGNYRPFHVSALADRRNSLVIDVPKPDSFFILDIENRPGGRVMIWDSHGVHLFARVIRPLGGVGRFTGTKYQNIGRLRANHTGVIDISTSRYGSIGGFQIIPLIHAFSKEMVNSWKLTQWMILASNVLKNPIAGKAPLFFGNLVTGTQVGEQMIDIWATYGRKPLILGRFNGGKWERLPEMTGRNDTALARLTHLRMYFPFTEEPLKICK